MCQRGPEGSKGCARLLQRALGRKEAPKQPQVDKEAAARAEAAAAALLAEEAEEAEEASGGKKGNRGQAEQAGRGPHILESAPGGDETQQG